MPTVCPLWTCQAQVGACGSAVQCSFISASMKLETDSYNVSLVLFTNVSIANVCHCEHFKNMFTKVAHFIAVSAGW